MHDISLDAGAAEQRLPRTSQSPARPPAPPGSGGTAAGPIRNGVRVRIQGLHDPRAPLGAQSGHQLLLAQVVQQRDLSKVVVEVEIGDDLAAVLGALVDRRAVVCGCRLLLLLVEAQMYLQRPRLRIGYATELSLCLLLLFMQAQIYMRRPSAHA